MAKANAPTVRTPLTPKLTPPGGMRLTAPKLTLASVMQAPKSKKTKAPKV
jgi:hypothetical protein